MGYLYGGAGAGKTYLCRRLCIKEIDALRGEIVEAAMCITQSTDRSNREVLARLLQRCTNYYGPAIGGRADITTVREAASEALSMDVFAIGYDPGFLIRKQRLEARVAKGRLRQSHLDLVMLEEERVQLNMTACDERA